MKATQKELASRDENFIHQELVDSLFDPQEITNKFQAPIWFILFIDPATVTTQY